MNDTLPIDGGGPRVVSSLMGAVDINNLGEVVFGVQFTSASGGGNAIYVAYLPEPAASVLAAAFALALLGGRPAIRHAAEAGTPARVPLMDSAASDRMIPN